ncbi:MAG: hypothetical protein AB7E47_01015 [Desulfovibrionaceae bacterium]
MGLILAAWCVTGFAPTARAASSPLDALADDIQYLDALRVNPATGFDPARISDLLDFVVGFTGKPAKVDLPDLKATDGKPMTDAFWSFSLKTPFSSMLRYNYDPSIPQCMTLPSVLRLGGWLNGDAAASALGGLWDKLPNVAAPVVFRGEEDEQTTPDTHTGGYYTYTTERLVTLFNYKGRDFLVTLSRLRQPSAIGRKGLVLGEDDEWNYFYSGLDGLKLPLFGWSDVDSYVYDSVSVFVQFADGPGATRVNALKWLHAGWRGLNMVGRSDIHDGLKRMETGMRQILESPLLPPAEELAEYAGKVRTLSDAELRGRVRVACPDMEELAKEHAELRRKEFAAVIHNGGYVDTLSRPQLESALLKAYMRGKVMQPAIIQAQRRTTIQ